MKNDDLKAYPIKFEIYDCIMEEVEAVVEANDEATSTVTIPGVQSPTSWARLSKIIQDCLHQMHPEVKE